MSQLRAAAAEMIWFCEIPAPPQKPGLRQTQRLFLPESGGLFFHLSITYCNFLWIHGFAFARSSPGRVKFLSSETSEQLTASEEGAFGKVIFFYFR